LLSQIDVQNHNLIVDRLGKLCCLFKVVPHYFKNGIKFYGVFIKIKIMIKLIKKFENKKIELSKILGGKEKSIASDGSFCDEYTWTCSSTNSNEDKKDDFTYVNC
jgi:hypothetical protein